MDADAELCERLLRVLRATTGRPSLEFDGAPVRLHGGFWADLFAFRLVGAGDGWDRELVARVMPDPGVACKETIVQEQVAAAGFPTPMVRASGGPDGGLGRAFMVMDRADGSPLLAALGRAAVANLPALAASVPETLAHTMAELHSLDPEPIRERLSGSCEVGTTLAEMLDGLHTGATVYGRADLSAAARWLIEHQPAPAPPEVICHGDLHPFNLLVDGDRNVSVLDWSAALIGARSYDVAFTSLVIAEPPLLVGPVLRPVVRGAGRLLSRRFVRRYQHHSGITIDKHELTCYQGAVCLRALVEVAGWVEAKTLDGRGGHPWVINGPAFAKRLSKLTRAEVRAR